MTEVTVTHTAAYKPGMTFDELTAFVEAALTNNVTGDTILEARITFGGKLKALTARGAGPLSRPGQCVKCWQADYVTTGPGVGEWVVTHATPDCDHVTQDGRQ